MKALLLRLFALCLALGWVPATAHCRIEALGFELPACSESCHADDAGAGHANDASTDACDLIENGFYKAGGESLQISPPLALVCACLICQHVAASAADADSHRDARLELDRLRPWVPQWHFVRRAAAPARAPDSLIA